MPRPDRTTVEVKEKMVSRPAVSELVRRLRRLSDKIAASGEKPLTRREMERELADRRGGIR